MTAFASFFIAGVAAVGAYERGEASARVARRHLALLVIPWALLSATALWRPNCGYLLGLGLFVLLVPPSVLLAVGLADVVVARGLRRGRRTLVGLGLLLAVVPTVLVLKLRPQLFVYNPVFGGVLGPIYDAELAVRPGLIVHQTAVVVAAVGLMAWARWTRWRDRASRYLAIGCSAVIACFALFSARLGVTQSDANLRRSLSEVATSARVALHYAPGSISSARVEALLDEAEFRLWQHHRRLGLWPSDTVHVYLYPDPDTKAALLGSRETSVVPVWLSSPQVHLLDERADGDLGHELVHVVAREAGDRWTGATWKVGLVEGLAVALEPPEGTPSPEAQVLAALDLPPEAGGLADPAASVVGSMDPLGFWTGRAGAAYSTTGAFTGWLLDAYGSDPLLAVYGGMSWSDAYGREIEELASAWRAHLRTLQVSEEARAFAAWRFGVPSLFETRCPHFVLTWQRRLREGDRAWDHGDVGEAGRSYARAAELAPDSLGTLLALSRLDLAVSLGAPSDPSRPSAESYLAADTTGRLWALRLSLAHARMLKGLDARGAYLQVLAGLPEYARQQRAIVRLFPELGAEELKWVVLPARDSSASVALARQLAGGSPSAAFFSALHYAEAGDMDSAWRVGREALDGLAFDPALALIGARLAYRADDLDAADDLSRRVETIYRQQNLNGPARQAADLRMRVAWRRTLAR